MSSARSRGVRPLALAAASATLDDQSPRSGRFERSTGMRAGTGSTPRATSAPRNEDARMSAISGMGSVSRSAPRPRHDGVQPVDQLQRVEGLGDVVVGAQVEALLDLGLLGLGREEDDREVLGVRVALEVAQQLE